MRRTRHTTRFAILGSALAFVTAACSLILDTDKVQCSNDGDCAALSAGSKCVNSVCTSPSSTGDGSTPDGESPDTSSPGVDSSTNPDIDGGTDAHFGADGCFTGTPTTTEQFLNACTTAQCTAFDNCAKLGLCDGGMLGPSPPDGGSTTTPSTAVPTGPACTDLAQTAGKQIVYVTGSSNFPPFLTQFAPVLSQSGYAVVWQTTNSCTGVNAAYNTDPSKRQIKDKKGAVTQFFDPNNGTPVNCLIDPTFPNFPGNGGNDTGTNTPVNVDVGESDIYAATCAANLGYTPNDPTIGEYFGPTMAMVFLVPGTSSETVISAEAAQAVYGRGGVPNVNDAGLPWTDPTQFFNRASSTATNQIISRAISVDPTKWWGSDKSSASNMVTVMQQVPPALANKTIGIISSDFADKNRGNLKELAFQARTQGCGFWPDSTPFTNDKINVRDGHYPMWGPLHFFTRLSSGLPSTAAGAFVTRFSVPKLDQALVQSIIQSGDVPECAMKVTRTEEMGDIKAFDPPVQCGCFFESVATKTVDTSVCQACNGPESCPSTKPACNYGFCEKQ